jgi:hypothetical protein
MRTRRKAGLFFAAECGNGFEPLERGQTMRRSLAHAMRAPARSATGKPPRDPCVEIVPATTLCAGQDAPEKEALLAEGFGLMLHPVSGQGNVRELGHEDE